MYSCAIHLGLNKLVYNWQIHTEKRGPWCRSEAKKLLHFKANNLFNAHDKLHLGALTGLPFRAYFSMYCLWKHECAYFKVVCFVYSRKCFHQSSYFTQEVKTFICLTKFYDKIKKIINLSRNNNVKFKFATQYADNFTHNLAREVLNTKN